MFRALLFIHILSAVIAFGPSFSIPIMATWIQKHDPAGNEFLMKMSIVLGKRQVTPFGILVGLSGVGLILTVGRPVTQPWLLAAIIIYLIALILGAFVQGPRGERMLRIAKGDLEGLNIPDDNAFLALMGEVKKARIVGAYLLLSFLAILVLMIWKPGV